VERTHEIRKERGVEPHVYWAFWNFGMDQNSGLWISLTSKPPASAYMFYVSKLRKYNPDAKHMVEHEQVDLQPDLTDIEHPVEIVDRKEQVLRNKIVRLVKVL
jgi:hypothetical protein